MLILEVYRSPDGQMGKNIRYLRRRKHMNMEQFCKYTGLSYQHLYCLERYHFQWMPIKPMEDLCRIFCLTPEEILKEDLEAKLKGKRIKYGTPCNEP